MNDARRYRGNAVDCLLTAKHPPKAKKFGIHFIQRSRWIKECIAR
jgi:hypothetical protein